MLCLLSVRETGVLDYFQHTLSLSVSHTNTRAHKHAHTPARLGPDRDPPRQLIDSPEPSRGTDERRRGEE